MFLHAVFWYTLCLDYYYPVLNFHFMPIYTSPEVECLSKWNSAKSLVTWTDPVQSCFPSAEPLPSVCQKTSSFLLFWRESYYLSIKNIWGIWGEKQIPSLFVSSDWGSLPAHLPVLTSIPQFTITCIRLWEQWDSEDMPLPWRQSSAAAVLGKLALEAVCAHHLPVLGGSLELKNFLGTELVGVCGCRPCSAF